MCAFFAGMESERNRQNIISTWRIIYKLRILRVLRSSYITYISMHACTHTHFDCHNICYLNPNHNNKMVYSFHVSVIVLLRVRLSLSNDKFIYQIKFRKDSSKFLSLIFSFSFFFFFFVLSALVICMHAYARIRKHIHICIGICRSLHHFSKSQQDYMDGLHCLAGNISIYCHCHLILN